MVIEYCISAPAWVVIVPFAFLALVILAVNRGWV